ncbi:MAG: glutamate-5-semialdehyde dehydrogenase [Candidatus Omnitrophota bacterium]
MEKKTRTLLERDLNKTAWQAKEASRVLSGLSSRKKNEVLIDMSSALLDHADEILGANKKDLRNAASKGLSKAFVDRLALNGQKIGEMSESMREIAKLEDPVGSQIRAWSRPNGLLIAKVRVPIGVILIIYESRPNVTSDCAGLCFKSGNAVILRGGSAAAFSNRAIFDALQKVFKRHGLPRGTVCLVDSAERKAVDILLQMDRLIDLVMPRGGESLILEVRNKSKIPVIKHYKGVCHIFVDAKADLEMAKKIVLNAKVQRPSVCNAVEKLLVHEDIAARFLPLMVEALQAAGVEIRADARARKVVKRVARASESDWSEEYLDLILAVKIVKDAAEAVRHINRYGSSHSDAIITSDEETAEFFLRAVDSACVYVNASTRFTDGYQFGFGAEIGISTDRLHARGPMGLEELTTYKYEIRGNGQVRE